MIYCSLPIRNLSVSLLTSSKNQYENSWCRPTTITQNAEYFAINPTGEFPPYCVKQGTLPDEIFIGALLALSAYPRADLIQNVFASRPEDFKHHGVLCSFFSVNFLFYLYRQTSREAVIYCYQLYCYHRLRMNRDS